MTQLDTNIKYLKGVGEKRAEQLKALGIDTVGALLRYYPRDYKDLKLARDIFDCSPGEKACIKAKITTPIMEQYIRSNMTVYKFSVTDSTGSMPITIFNNKYLANSLHEGSEYLFFGKINEGSFLPSMTSPEIFTVESAGIIPVYHASGAISSKLISKLTKTALTADLGDDPLPESIREQYKLCDHITALRNIHFPQSEEALERAKKRLVFEELFILQASLMLLKGKNRARTGHILKRSYKDEFLKLIPFSLTAAQSRVVDECLGDMMSGRAMNRLIQGDVGSGKTAVAAALMHSAARNGLQSVLMAPTEILAEQHYKTVISFFEGSGIKCCLLTGSTPKKAKQQIKDALQNGEYDIAVGTHALITGDTLFNHLGLVITDEQHRFGVAQRAALADKGIKPHTLVMSATPIPRTLGLIIYGDLDISIIDQYPKGRQAIESFFVGTSYRKRVYNYIKKHLDEGAQGYIVCPMVEESEEATGLASAEAYHKGIKDSAFKGYTVGLLHGKMNPKDKDAVMRKFKDGEIQLLVCTTVIEVGIDVPNAAIMLIENAERFGLSQLHQLRGRIGRGSRKSSCILMSDATSPATTERLNVIKHSTDGFKIADEDLRLRGPGDFLGNRQHGLPKLNIADISSDITTLKAAGMAAAMLLEADPKLKAPECLALREEIKALYKRLNEN